MKKCLRQKCGKEFEPTKPKQVYCSTKCRTYAHREKNFKGKLQTEKKNRESPLISAARGRDVSGVNNDEIKPKTWIDKVQAAADANKHPLWKEGDPKEGSMAFYLKYECYTYSELENKLR